MIKFIPALLLIHVCSLPVGAAHAADASDGAVRIAAISALNPTPLQKTLTRAVATDLESREASLGAPEAYLRSIQLQNQQQLTTSADSDETQAVAVVATPLLPEERSDTHLSPTGIGSLYWAARHPTQAWRVLLPIQSGDGSGASANVRASCVVFPQPPNDAATC